MPLRTSLENLTLFGLYRQSLLHTGLYENAAELCRLAGPVHAIPGVSAQLSVWARSEARNPSWLEKALHHDRSIVRAPSLQSDLLIIPAEDYAAYHRARESLVQTDLYEYLEQFDQTPGSNEQADIPVIASRVLDVLSARGACTIEELSARVPELAYRIPNSPGNASLGTSKLGDRLVPAMCARGSLVRAETQGSWRSDHFKFAALSSWLPDANLDALSTEDAITTVVSRYLQAFGPATVGDIVHWMGAVRRRQVVSALYRLGSDVSRLELRDYPGEYYILTNDIDDLLNPPHPTRCINLLPPRDSYVMAYRDPARLIDHEYLDRVYDWSGDSTGVLLFDGRVTGIWRQRGRYDRIVIRTFDKLSPTSLAMVVEEGRRMGQFMGQHSFSVDIAHTDDS